MVSINPNSMSARLRRAGFDKCKYVPDKGWSVKCSGCKALVINGVPCHELHCSNLKKAQREQL